MDNESLLDCWTMFSREHDNISVDRMLCAPELRSKFLVSVAGNDPTATAPTATSGTEEEQKKY